MPCFTQLNRYIHSPISPKAPSLPSRYVPEHPSQDGLGTGRAEERGVSLSAVDRRRAHHTPRRGPASSTGAFHGHGTSRAASAAMRESELRGLRARGIRVRGLGEGGGFIRARPGTRACMVGGPVVRHPLGREDSQATHPARLPVRCPPLRYQTLRCMSR